MVFIKYMLMLLFFILTYASYIIGTFLMLKGSYLILITLDEAFSYKKGGENDL